MAYNRDVTGLQSTLAMIERIDSPQQLQQIAQQYQQQPNGGAIIAAALAQAQKLKQLQSGMMSSDKAGSDEAPVVDEAIAGIASRETPEESGIARIPAPNIANMAEGGIVAFAGGGNPKGDRMPSFDEALDVEGVDDPKARAFLKALYGQESGSGADTRTSNKGAVGHMQILPGTFKGVADPDMDINNPFDNMRAGIRYGLQGLTAAKGDPVLAGAHYYGGPGGMKALAAGQARIDKDNPTYPNTRQYGQSVAKRMFDLLPMGAAQAEALPPPRGQTAQAAPADVPSIYTGPGYTPEGLEELGQRLDVIREAQSKAKPPSLRERKADPDAAKRYQALQDLNSQSQREYEKYAENIYNKPAFAAPSAGGKGVGTTTLPAAQAVAKEVAAPDIAAQAKRQAEPQPYAGELRSGIQAEDKQGAAGFDQPPEELPLSEKKMVGLAKEAIPASERKGWTDDMLMQFFLSMMAGQSPNALANIGAAGLGALKYGQEAKKAELERRKDEQAIRTSEAEARYKTAQARSWESEEKTDAKLRIQAATLAQRDLEDWQKVNFGATPAQVAAKRQELFSIYTAALRQQDTMGAGAALDLSKWGSPSKI